MACLFLLCWPVLLSVVSLGNDPARPLLQANFMQYWIELKLTSIFVADASPSLHHLLLHCRVGIVEQSAFIQLDLSERIGSVNLSLCVEPTSQQMMGDASRADILILFSLPIHASQKAEIRF